MFFFSSRRRHTRLQGDWSSDVCSSDLKDRRVTPLEVSAEILRVLKKRAEDQLGGELDGAVITVPAYFDDAQRQATRDAARSEERRVGKECRSRWSPYH